MAETRHTPLRTCRVCRAKKLKSELERWIIGPDGLVLDSSKTAPGRGHYSCRSGCSTQIHTKVRITQKKDKRT